MRNFFLTILIITSVIPIHAANIIVKNIDELNAANKKAQPGDIIILQNGNWNNVIMKLDCRGTAAKPIIVRAQTPGKMIISGQSQLRIGGEYLVIDGFWFTNGYAGDEPVISFRNGSAKVANHCRVTNSSIYNFNNPKRMDENYWVAFYGKNNRLDHCSFTDKKNMGVLLAVILDDERSRENFHSIDHNYFGKRTPLASNSGEIIRVGVSQHCEFNSNTQITDNFFEHCDGETEIVSIKSGSNTVSRNLFKECQGGVVLRHGNFNTVENNIFLGNGKAGTGGVRIINKGQWVVNNLFYQCRGIDFRSPLSVMNGIPNSPAHRYVQVTDAVVANNSFVDCSPVSFCEGSDAERTLPPANTWLINNIFYNTGDSIIYHVFDKMDGFHFKANKISPQVNQETVAGFIKTKLALTKAAAGFIPVSMTKEAPVVPDSLQREAQQRLKHKLNISSGFSGTEMVKTILTNATTACGASWATSVQTIKAKAPLIVNCNTTEEIYQQLEGDQPVVIYLTNNRYKVNSPFIIRKNVQFTSNKKTISFETGEQASLFQLAGDGNLVLSDLVINGEKVSATSFIANDTSGSSSHYNLLIQQCRFTELGNKSSCKNFFFANRYMVADSIVIRNNSFSANNVNTFMLSDEKDDKGYYSAEKIMITSNEFASQQGILLDIYRGGNDESTMGPQLLFKDNRVIKCYSFNSPLFSFMGVQVTNIQSNLFNFCNPGGIFISYSDKVRARHLLTNNIISGCGQIKKDPFVTAPANIFETEKSTGIPEKKSI